MISKSNESFAVYKRKLLSLFYLFFLPPLFEIEAMQIAKDIPPFNSNHLLYKNMQKAVTLETGGFFGVVIWAK